MGHYEESVIIHRQEWAAKEAATPEGQIESKPDILFILERLKEEDVKEVEDIQTLKAALGYTWDLTHRLETQLAFLEERDQVDEQSV